MKGRFCATRFRTVRNSLILNGEMSEWFKEHAWKSTPPARAEAHQNVPTPFSINNFRYNDLRRHVPVTEALYQGFTGVCDTDRMKRLASFVRW